MISDFKADARRFAKLMVIVAVMVGFASRADAVCPPMPEVPWWSTSHAKIRSYVKHQYDGQWGPYIAKWEKSEKRMRAVLDRKGKAVLKSRDMVLSGKSLEDYVASIVERIEIVRCLASEEEGAEEELTVEVYSCPRVPEVDWWGDLNHDAMIQTVNDRHNGVWWPYKDRWEGEMERLTKKFEAGDSATVNELGFALGAEELGLYISQLAQMVAIVHCLADDENVRPKNK